MAAYGTSKGSLLILIDGGCPICRREAEMLRKLDNGRSRIQFENIAAPWFEAGKYGLTQEQVMGAVHAVKPSGRVVKGMEVFRQAYAAVGLGWVLAWTGLPGINILADKAYAVFAKNRMRLTGRAGECADGSCRVEADEDRSFAEQMSAAVNAAANFGRAKFAAIKARIARQRRSEPAHIELPAAELPALPAPKLVGVEPDESEEPAKNAA